MMYGHPSFKDMMRAEQQHMMRAAIKQMQEAGNRREPCPLCNGLGGWDRHGKPMPPDANVPERTTCQGCAGCGLFCGWLREVMT